MRFRVLFIVCLLLQPTLLIRAQEPADADGFRIHPSKPRIQLGAELAFASSGDRHWDFQHIREKIPTQLISRGSRQVTLLKRSPIPVDDFNRFKITQTDGSQLNILDWLTEQHCDAILVLKNGQVINEQYFHGMTPDRDHVLFSLGKSLTATMLATLLDHQLKESVRIEEYVPALSDTNLKGVTIRELMDMKSGIRYKYASALPGELSDLQIHMAATGTSWSNSAPRGAWDFLAKLPMGEFAHGEVFRYKEIDVAAAVLAAESATDERFAELFSSRIWSKLGTEHDASVRCDAVGEAAPSFGMMATARDIGRWGEMCLQRGAWNQEQIVPQAFFDDLEEIALSGKPLPEEAGDTLHADGTRYRSYFWLPKNNGDRAYCAHGGNGQICYVNPRRKVVVVMFCSWPGHTPELTKSQWNGCLEIAKHLSK